MKNNLLLIFAFVTLQFSISAQKNYGFYGKTNFAEFTSVSYFPLLKNILSNDGTGYKKSGNSLKMASTDWFNTGFRASVGRAFQKNFAASFEYGVDFWSTPLQMDYYFIQNGNGSVLLNFEKHENLSMRTTHFMPKLHFASKSALLPLGLNHEIGFGYTSTRVKEKEYLYTLKSSVITPESSSDYIDFDRKYRGVQLMYCLRMRKPLSKSILLNYGLRYTIDVALSSSSPNSNSAKYYSMSNGEIFGLTSANNFRNILSFDLGLTYAF